MKIIEAEIKNIKKQEERYNRAYGAGLFTVEQLKEYITPLKEKRVKTALNNLSFAEKRAIILNIVDRAVASQQFMQLHGSISLNNYVQFKTNHRHSRIAECRQIFAF